MDANPVLKPKVATPALVLSSVAVLICVVYFVASVAARGHYSSILGLAALASFLVASVVGAIWFARVRRRRSWTEAANERWKQFDDMKQTHGTTTEVTVLSVDALEPTGSWITIRWDRFDHVQRAWIEALHESIWPGATLLIAPDPVQVRPGLPWPSTYYIYNSNFLAWAPGRQPPPRPERSSVTSG